MPPIVPFGEPPSRPMQAPVRGPVASGLPLDVSILTPSWNRAHLLPRLHASITANIPDGARIEWVVVDDGSTDGTPALLRRLGQTGAVPLRHVRIEHGGKHRALNAGFANAQGRWIMIVDSDDWLLDRGVERALAEIAKAEAHGADIAFLPMRVIAHDRQYTFERPGRSVSFADRVNREPPFDASLLLSCKACEARFPEIEGETFLSESALLCDLAPRYRIYLSDAVCVGVEYQPDGLSHNLLRMRTQAPEGATLTYARMAGIPLRPALRVRALANFGRFWWHCLFTRRKSPASAGLIGRLMIPLTLPFALRDLWRLGRNRQ